MIYYRKIVFCREKDYLQESFQIQFDNYRTFTQRNLLNFIEMLTIFQIYCK